ncbi:MAG: cytochrome c oxidase assembly protein [Sphingomonadaceae bacterium]|uniref:cytochrome c oxidase assembly protein n=1 Tax=Thermaurantiacus sp. TaxID=2820283 RepID=UPI00298F3331|nr:cytochrome c oxidase assembly protein [Thermaurantiacus sp.]MCS6987839.1 cytochrome c oxidase assembly protein [Sphingomonadaceae bacterium]MDW8414941.1 cytochrome c oxidase assembly protein [Thermaurantiacus sp.]
MSVLARTRTAWAAFGIAAAMLGLAFASVPLYRLFCQVTGFGGTPQVAAQGPATAPGPVAGTRIRVRFDGNVRRDLPWEFRPVEPFADLAVGERRMAFYRAVNHGDRPITGVATFNVTPERAGRHFVKVQCFCFNEQTLAPGQAVDMPVVYYVDPAILDDPEARGVEEITLSYSFFPVPEPRQPPSIRATDMAAMRAGRPGA